MNEIMNEAAMEFLLSPHIAQTKNLTIKKNITSGSCHHDSSLIFPPLWPRTLVLKFNSPRKTKKNNSHVSLLANYCFSFHYYYHRSVRRHVFETSCKTSSELGEQCKNNNGTYNKEYILL